MSRINSSVVARIRRELRKGTEVGNWSDATLAAQALNAEVERLEGEAEDRDARLAELEETVEEHARLLKALVKHTKLPR